MLNIEVLAGEYLFYCNHDQKLFRKLVKFQSSGVLQEPNTVYKIGLV